MGSLGHAKNAEQVDKNGLLPADVVPSSLYLSFLVASSPLDSTRRMLTES